MTLNVDEAAVLLHATGDDLIDLSHSAARVRDAGLVRLRGDDPDVVAEGHGDGLADLQARRAAEPMIQHLRVLATEALAGSGGGTARVSGPSVVT